MFVVLLHFQVITKLLYLLNQGESFTKVVFVSLAFYFLQRSMLLYHVICDSFYFSND